MSAEARSGDHRVVLYVDGGLDAVERVAFEAALEQSPELRRDVRHARVLRDLVAALPRRRAPLPELDALLERLDVEAGTEGQPAVARLLRSLPSVAAPVGALDHVVGLALRERSRRRPAVLPLRRVALQLAAAAVVVFAAVGLWRSGLTRPEPPPKFREIDLVVNRQPSSVQLPVGGWGDVPPSRGDR